MLYIHHLEDIYCAGGLDEHFKKPDCVVQYMKAYKDQEKCILSNYKLLFLHVFKGLQYLHSKGIVHGDVKGINIIVFYTCRIMTMHC